MAGGLSLWILILKILFQIQTNVKVSPQIAVHLKTSLILKSFLPPLLFIVNAIDQIANILTLFILIVQEILSF